VAQGAEWLHVIDLDAVFNDGENTANIKEITRTVRLSGAGRRRYPVDGKGAWLDGSWRKPGRIATAASALTLGADVSLLKGGPKRPRSLIPHKQARVTPFN
jgi:hypothetical protein